MHAVILADRSMALRERSMLRRLQIGLADEGVEVLYVVPASARARVQGGMFARVLTLDDSPSMFRSTSMGRLVEQVAGMLPMESQAALVHVFGEGMLPLARRLVSKLRLPLVIDVSSAAMAERVSAWSGLGEAGDACAIVACDAALQRRMTSLLASGRAGQIGVRSVPLGVLCPSEPMRILREGRTPTLLVVAGGEQRAALASMLESLAALAGDGREFVALVDAEAIERSQLGPMISRLGLSERVSLVPSVEQDRVPALHADVLVLPEATGLHRSLTLEAMAHGMLVVALADPLVSVLRDGQTAVVLPHSSTGLWRAALSEAMEQAERSRRVALAARAVVAMEHRASAQTAGTLDTYEWLTGAGSISIRPGAAGESAEGGAR